MTYDIAKHITDKATTTLGGANHQPDTMLRHYAQACSNYTQAYQVFMNIQPQLGRMPVRGDPELESGIKFWAHSIWQWLLLFQVVGEHLRFSIENFLVDLNHYHDHPGTGLEQTILRLVQISKDLPDYWGTNDGLGQLRFSNFGLCPNEGHFISSFTKARLSALRLQVQRLINLRSWENAENWYDIPVPRNR